MHRWLRVWAGARSKILGVETLGSYAGQLARFVAVGALNLLASYSLYLFFTLVLRLDFILAYAVVYAGWAFVAYELQRRWVFGARKGKTYIVLWLSVQLFLLALGSLLMLFLIDVLQVSVWFAYLITLGIVTAVSFVAMRAVFTSVITPSNRITQELVQ